MKLNLKLILFIILTILAGLALLSLMLARFSRQTPQVTTFPTPTLVPIFLRNIPTGERIDVSGVSVKNPYASAVQLTAQGDSLMEEASEFRLIYLKPFNKFLISIKSSPFEENRQKAERAFLERLEISENEACNLPVEISTTASINPNEAGQIFKLSFCNR